jgi:outer membrane protein assembly factor BamB
MSDSWTTFMRDQQRTGYCPEEFEPPLELAWKRQFINYPEVSNCIHGSAIIVGETVYFAWDHLYALDLHTGHVLWRSKTRIDSQGRGSPLFWSDSLWLAGREGIYQLDPKNGDLIRYWPSQIFGTSVTIADNKLYWVAVTSTLWSLDLQTEEMLPFPDKVEKNTILSFDSERLYGSVFKDYGSRLVAWDRATRRTAWEYIPPQGTSFLVNPLSVGSSRVYACFKKGSGLIALDAATGQVDWNFSDPVRTPPCLSDGRIYIGGNAFYALDAETGTIIWQQGAEEPRSASFHFDVSAPICVGSSIYVGGGSKRMIYGFDARQGDLIWHYETEDMVYSTPVYANGHLLIGSHDGYLYCFRQAHP